MANPNLLAITSVTGNTILAEVTTISSNVLVNNAGSNQIFKVNEISLSNFTSSSTIFANVFHCRGTSRFYKIGNVNIPASSTLNLVGKDNSFYMLEGDYLQANLSANSSSHISVVFEVIS